jgi:hypothetical protein
MRLPWISRSAHEAIVGIWIAQLAELKEDRKLLLDRLATLGLGGPLYQVPAAEDPTEGEPVELADPEGEMIEELMRLRRRPAKLADALTRNAYRDYGKRGTGPKVAWVPAVAKVNAALDAAEEQGKRTTLQA